VHLLGPRWRHRAKMATNLGKNFISKWSPEYCEQSPPWFYRIISMLYWSNRRKSSKNCSKCSKSAFLGSKWRHRAKMVINFWKSFISK
jgi:hypothetical protein